MLVRQVRAGLCLSLGRFCQSFTQIPLAALQALALLYHLVIEGTQPRLMVLAVGIFAFTDLTAFHQFVQSLTYSICYSKFNTFSLTHRDKVQSIRVLLHLDPQLGHSRALRNNKAIIFNLCLPLNKSVLDVVPQIPIAYKSVSTSPYRVFCLSSSFLKALGSKGSTSIPTAGVCAPVSFNSCSKVYMHLQSVP